MRWMNLLLALSIALPVSAARQTSRLIAPPPGATLPVALMKTIKSQNVTVGERVTARFMQRVPVASGSYLPGKVEIAGQVAAASPSSLSILFTQLRWKGQSVPIHVGASGCRIVL